MATSNKISNKQILDLIFSLSGAISDVNLKIPETSSHLRFIWSKKLRNDFNRVVRSLEKQI